MTVSELEIELKALEASRSILSTRLTVLSCVLVGFTVLVVAGLVFEYRPDFREWFTGRPRDRRDPWPVRIGTLLVILGVAGEVGFTFWSFKVESDLKTINSNIEGVLKKEIALLGTSATEAAKEADHANDLAEQANVESGKAKVQAGEANKQLVQLRKDAQALEAEANKTKSDLIDLAVCNAPRVITPWQFGQGGISAGRWTMGGGKLEKSYVEPLIPMAGQIVFIEYVTDAEPRRAALNIAHALVDAKWNVQKPMRMVDLLEDGVSVQPSWPFPIMPDGQMPDNDVFGRADDAAEKLVDFLHSYNWQASRGSPFNAQGKMIRDPKILPPGAIRIQVGLYPSVIYVSPPGQKAFDARVEEFKQARERSEAERWKAMISRMPPDTRERMEKARQKWDARTKSEIGNRPCRVLNPFF